MTSSTLINKFSLALSVSFAFVIQHRLKFDFETSTLFRIISLIMHRFFSILFFAIIVCVKMMDDAFIVVFEDSRVAQKLVYCANLRMPRKFNPDPV